MRKKLMCTLLICVLMLTLVVQVSAQNSEDYYLVYTREDGTVTEHNGYIDCYAQGGGEHSAFWYFNEASYSVSGDYDISFSTRVRDRNELTSYIFFVIDPPICESYYTMMNNWDCLELETDGYLWLRRPSSSDVRLALMNFESWHNIQITRVDVITGIWIDGNHAWSGTLDNFNDNIQFGTSTYYTNPTEWFHMDFKNIIYSLDIRQPPVPIPDILEEELKEEPEKKPPPAPSLCLTDIEHSNSVQSGEEFNVTLNITNKGNRVAKDVEVTVYFNEYKLACDNSTLKLGDIQAGETVAVNFTLTALETDQETSDKLWIEASANNMNENCGTSTIINIKPTEIWSWFNPLTKPFLFSTVS